MRLKLAMLDPDGADFTGSVSPGALEIAPDDPLFAETNGIRYAVHVQLLPDALLARGSVALTLKAFCVRCREPFELDVCDEAFFADIPLTDTPNEVDLTPAMREAILLALPSHPVCREGCRGLCTACGADRNRVDCGCVSPNDQSWSVLDGLT